MARQNQIEFAHYTYYKQKHSAGWLVNPYNSKQLIFAVARCNPKDDFNRKIGRELVTERIERVKELIRLNPYLSTKAYESLMEEIPDIDYSFSGVIDIDEIYDYMREAGYLLHVIRYDQMYEDNILTFDYISRWILYGYFEVNREWG